MIANTEITSYELKFPKDMEELMDVSNGKCNTVTGKTIVLQQGLNYDTMDEVEIEWASRQYGIMVRDPDDYELLSWIRDPVTLPTIVANIEKRLMDKYKWVDPKEEEVKKVLTYKMNSIKVS